MSTNQTLVVIIIGLVALATIVIAMRRASRRLDEDVAEALAEQRAQEQERNP